MPEEGRRARRRVEHQNRNCRTLFVSRSARQEQPKTKQRKRRPSATEEGERALKQVIVLLDDYAKIEVKTIIHFIKTFPDSEHVERWKRCET